MTPLPVVQPEAIASHADMFRCEPYRVNLTARACAGRQADARRKGTSTRPTSATALSKCSGCALGATVAARLKGVEDVGAPLAVAVEPPPERRPEAPPPVSMVMRLERPPVVDDEPPPVAVAEGAPAAPLPVVARALSAVRRERHRGARRRAAKAHASPALERAVRGSLRRLVSELFAVLARATLAAAGVSPRRA